MAGIMDAHSRRSLYLVYPPPETPILNASETSKKSTRAISEGPERIAMDQLSELKIALRNASPSGFWDVLCRGLCQITQSQHSFVTKRIATKPEHGKDRDEGSCVTVASHYENGTGQMGSRYNIAQQHCGLLNSEISNDKTVLVPSNTSSFLPNKPHAGDNPTIWEGYLSIPIFALGGCVGHFGVMWTADGLIRALLGWEFLELLFHSLEDIIAQRLMSDGVSSSCPTAPRPESLSSPKTPPQDVGPAVLEYYAKKISHELRTPLQGIMGLSDLMHAAVNDASSEATSSTTRKTFDNLREDIEAVQSSTRRAVDAADNVVQAYEMNMLLPEVKTPPISSLRQGFTPPLSRGVKRRRSDADFIEHAPLIRRSVESMHAPGEEGYRGSIFVPSEIISTTAFDGPDAAAELNDESNKGFYSPAFLQSTSSGLQLTDLRHCIKTVVDECVKREDRLEWMRPIDIEHGQRITVQTRASNGDVNIKTVVWTIEPDVPEYILVEQRDMAKMISCVLNNALKFTDVGRISLVVRFSPRRRSITVNIKDTGPGISPAFRSEIFKPFSQEDDSISRCKEGLGLGLVVAKGIAERLKGDLNLVSADVQGLHRGTEFSMHIPVSPSAAPTPTPTSHPFNEAVHFPGTKDSQTPSTSISNITSFEPIPPTAAPESASSLAPTTSSFSPIVDHHQPSASPLQSPFTEPDPEDYWGKKPHLVRNVAFERHIPHETPQNASSDYMFAVPNKRVLPMDMTPSPAEPECNRSFAASHPMNFLVAEDNTVNRKLLVKMLAKLGYDARTQIREACDGLEAVRQVKASTPDSLPSRRCSSAPPPSKTSESTSPMDVDPPVASTQPIDMILMDLWMPNMDGYEATEQILQMCKANTEARLMNPSSTPLILAVTADATQASLDRAARAGMGGLMLKPFGIRDLERLIREGWAKRQQRAVAAAAAAAAAASDSDGAGVMPWRKYSFALGTGGVAGAGGERRRSMQEVAAV